MTGAALRGMFFSVSHWLVCDLSVMAGFVHLIDMPRFLRNWKYSTLILWVPLVSLIVPFCARLGCIMPL